MRINSKYNLNQKVWLIRREKRREWTTCKACTGIGEIKLDNGEKSCCPKCYGEKGKYHFFEFEWSPRERLTIGIIQITLTNIEPDDIFNNMGHFKEGETTIEVQYMCYETGVGSGSCYYEKDLWESHNEAKSECKKRNNGENATSGGDAHE